MGGAETCSMLHFNGTKAAYLFQISVMSKFKTLRLSSMPAVIHVFLYHVEVCRTDAARSEVFRNLTFFCCRIRRQSWPLAARKEA